MLMASPTRSALQRHEALRFTRARAGAPCFAFRAGTRVAALACAWRHDAARATPLCRTPRLLHVTPPGAVDLGAKAASATEPYDPPNINRMQTDDSDDYTPRGPALFPPQFDMEQHVAEAWQHWERLGSPRFVMAPMVDQSELAFRAMGRQYGCELAYTPMFHSKIFSETPRYRREHFQTDAADRPLAVQFCANNPRTLLRAARFVEGECDAVDINLGCPQDIARRGKYGSFLMDDPDRVHDLVLTLKHELSTPVWAKIRYTPALA